MTQVDRSARMSGSTASDTDQDRRTPFQRDRDRILYADYFRRLSGVTQVASALEGGIFHNRLTHSIKVAQVGRRLAELLLSKHGGGQPALAEQLDPDVVEAAALAHDLGHPPFGHVADESLCELATDHGLEDGFEGNAQTFRIATRLSVRRGTHGLDLTRATLAAISKYPWARARGEGVDEKQRRKFSFFDDDNEAATFAMAGLTPGTKTLECQVMDLADAITYSVHDLEDFYRAGLVPIDRLVRNEEYRREFLLRWQRDKPSDPSQKHAQNTQNWPGVKNLLSALLSDESEPGTKAEALLLDSFRSVAISQFIGAVDLSQNGSGAFQISLREPYGHTSKFLQRLIWDYVILSPRLATQQAGQIHIVEGLFEYFLDSLKQSRFDRLPTRFRTDGIIVRDEGVGPRLARFAIDVVATLSETEASSLYKRIRGYEGGSVLDMVM
jgi:dGTPase